MNQYDFLDRNNIIQLGIEPNRIDILMELVGVNFETCYNSKIVIEVDGIKINVIDRDNLIKNKHSVGRLSDLADAEQLKLKRKN
ncbi:MAG: hypothetical protein FJ218_04280 [Ignavibacteria bacterium]|nr:hypothetical protein [Ignavibacteria bacterium]